jgi:hypothetical protein
MTAPTLGDYARLTLIARLLACRFRAIGARIGRAEQPIFRHRDRISRGLAKRFGDNVPLRF